MGGTRCWRWLIAVGAGWLALIGAGAAEVVYRQDFTGLKPGDLPEEFMVLEGPFTVQEADGQKFMELAGAPLETFAVLFGPAHQENWGVQARFQGTAKGRRFPVFALGLGGMAGYRLEVVPARKTLELFKGEEVRASVAFDWTDGAWTWLRLRIRKTGDLSWRVEGKAWRDGSPEPAAWMIGWDEKDTPLTQRASVWGKSFSGTPIRFDDLVVRADDK